MTPSMGPFSLRDHSTELAPKKDMFDNEVAGQGFPDEDHYHGHLGSTRYDRTDMERMGKVQQLRVGYSYP